MGSFSSWINHEMLLYISYSLTSSSPSIPFLYTVFWVKQMHIYKSSSHVGSTEWRLQHQSCYAMLEGTQAWNMSTGRTNSWCNGGGVLHYLGCLPAAASGLSSTAEPSSRSNIIPSSNQQPEICIKQQNKKEKSNFRDHRIVSWTYIGLLPSCSIEYH